MATKALLARIDARHGQEAALEAFLNDSLRQAQHETDTSASFALRLGRDEYAIFDVFPDDAAREAHLHGPLASALLRKVGDLLARPPLIQRAEVLADKLPNGAAAPVTKALLLTMKAKLGHEEEMAEFLRRAQPLVLNEPKTTAWFAIHFDSWAGGHGEFGIFDVFPDNGGRFQHLTGHLPRELAKHSFAMLGSVPDIDLINVLAAKLH